MPSVSPCPLGLPLRSRVTSEEGARLLMSTVGGNVRQSDQETQRPGMQEGSLGSRPATSLGNQLCKRFLGLLRGDREVSTLGGDTCQSLSHWPGLWSPLPGSRLSGWRAVGQSIWWAQGGAVVQTLAPRSCVPWRGGGAAWILGPSRCAGARARVRACAWAGAGARRGTQLRLQRCCELAPSPPAAPSPQVSGPARD